MANRITWLRTNREQFIFHIPYRARGNQTFRRSQLQKAIKSITTYFSKYTYQFKIIVCEQNDDMPFNRGVLFNIGFLESEKRFPYASTKYIQFNTDIEINDVSFPMELLKFTNGFMEINSCITTEGTPSTLFLANCCIYDKKSYLKCNGFPNNLYGWGGDDFAMKRRIKSKNINFIQTTESLSKFVSEDISQQKLYTHNDQEVNCQNITKALNDEIEGNGVDSCKYTIDAYGEFHDENSNVYHLMVSIV